MDKPTELTIKDVENFFEDHVCKGSNNCETWLTPGGKEFWLIFKGNTDRFTWIEFCPFCGYRPSNLRHDWNKKEKRDKPEGEKDG